MCVCATELTAEDHCAARRLLLGPREWWCCRMPFPPPTVVAATWRSCAVAVVTVSPTCSLGPAGESPKTPARAKRRLRPPPVVDDAHRGRRSFPWTHAAHTHTHGHSSPTPRNSLPPPIPHAPNAAWPPSTVTHRPPNSPSPTSLGRPKTIIRFRILLLYYILYYMNAVYWRVKIDIGYRAPGRCPKE